VQEKDARAAEALLRFALFKEVAKRTRKNKKRRLNTGAGARLGGGHDSDEEESEEEGESDEEEEEPKRMSMPPGKEPGMDVDESEYTGELQPERFQLFRSKLAKIFSTKLEDSENVKLTELLPMINEGLTTGELFGSVEAVEALRAMGQSEEVMLDDDGVVWKI